MGTTTRRQGLPFVWPTWLTGLLSGDKQCTWASWYRAHFKYEKRPDESFDFAAWSAAHQRLVNKRHAELEADGWTVTVEGQNDFRLKGQTALLSGKPDLVAVRGGEKKVIDCKTGKPRKSDWWQVLIYMTAIPRSRQDLSGLAGEVCYEDRRIDIQPEELTGERQDAIFALLRRLGSDERPRHVPSRFECQFCDVADCTERYAGDTEPQAVAVGEF
jgi:hypothetical protein